MPGAVMPLQRVVRRVAAMLAEAGRQRADPRQAAVTRLSSRLLSKGASVHVIRWGSEDLLVGCTERSLSVLARRPVDPGAGGPG